MDNSEACTTRAYLNIYLYIERSSIFFFDVYECNGGKPNAIFRSKKVQET